MTRTEPDRLGWENVGVERDVGRVRRWALPAQVALASPLARLASLMGRAQTEDWRRYGIPGLPEHCHVETLAWAHRPSPDWTVPRD